ncbi:hypothetical protein [Acanthopleuribacter pedis]|uniref:Uncharacterized protein n=1 Tax=Acanthopleuribacter pedis TaxID=442870 RepID=A0A8J7QCK8_9BACT|nr:hypothetical protein [Acanthopleuribacter pedis]MBO1317075.1 hypothetical protein [Acanthopleuribacter pedis]
MTREDERVRQFFRAPGEGAAAASESAPAITLCLQQDRRLLDLWGGRQQPLVFGRNFGDARDGAVFRSYFKKDARYRYRTRKENGRRVGETNFSRRHFTIDLEDETATFTFISHVEHGQRLILNYFHHPGRSTAAKPIAREQKVAGLSGVDFVVPELCVDLEQNRLPDLKLSFQLERHTQTLGEHPLLAEQFARAGRRAHRTTSVILRRLATRENENRAKLTSYVFTQWHDFFASDGLPFTVIAQKDGLYLLPADRNLAVRLVKGDEHYTVPIGEPAPLAVGWHVHLGELVLEAQRSPG